MHLHSVDHLGLGLMLEDPEFDPEFSEPPPNWFTISCVLLMIMAALWLLLA
jgi:hypothetical protein